MAETNHTHAGPRSSDAGLGPAQYLTFALAEETFAIPILNVQEIRCWEKATKVPRAPEEVLGVIDLRGAIVPVVSLRARLQMPHIEVTPATVVIVVRLEQGANGSSTTVGCVVDGVSDVADIDHSSLNTAPVYCGTVESHFLAGVARVNQRLVPLLDLPRLLHGTAFRDETQALN